MPGTVVGFAFPVVGVVISPGRRFLVRPLLMLPLLGLVAIVFDDTVIGGINLTINKAQQGASTTTG